LTLVRAIARQRRCPVGASESLAAAQAARAPKDGTTLIAGVGTTTSMLKVLKRKLGFDPINDFAAISLDSFCKDARGAGGAGRRGCGRGEGG
jgi:hypothetical protein